MAAIVKIGYNYNNDESPNNNEETKINNQTSSPLSEPIEFYKMAKFPAPLVTMAFSGMTSRRCANTSPMSRSPG